jgi:hypothetical protein
VAGIREQFKDCSWAEIWGDILLIVMLYIGITQNNLTVVCVCLCTKIVLDALERTGIR